MANRIKVAIESAILTLRQQGWSLRRIARELGVHRETVARYVHLAEVSSKPAKNPPTGTSGTGQPKPANPPPGNFGPDEWHDAVLAAAGLDPVEAKPAKNPPPGNQGPRACASRFAR